MNNNYLTDEEKKELRKLKTAKTKAEYSRVFDHFCLPPRDIFVEYKQKTYIKKAWQALNRFGWGKWEEHNNLYF